jgi:methyl-accepting chemotaxis protein
MKRTSQASWNTRSPDNGEKAAAQGVMQADQSAEPNGHGVSNSQPKPPRSQVEIRALLRGLQAMRDGDFSVRLPGDWIGLEGKLADTFNDIVSANEQMAHELKRVGYVVGKEGKTRERVKFTQAKGAWGDMEISVNALVDDLLRPTTEVTGAIAAVAQGDLRQTVRLDVDGRPLEGEFLRSARIVNTMIQQLGVFTSEVTRVAR